MRIDHRWESGGFHLDVAFTTEARCFALFGPSGVGKSSILACISGLVRATHGHVKLAGRTLHDSATGTMVPPHLRKIGLVPQQATLFPLHTVRGNLLFGHTAGNAALTMESVVGLLEIGHLLDRLPRNLSGGEKQRVALGRAILSGPELLLADEPLSGLDGSRRDRLLELLIRVRDELEVPMVLVTHSQRVVEALAHEVLHLEPGNHVLNR